ncbi:restriction endonuclease subunit S [Desulfotomaculum sp. OF05-3]|jgi:type I restriction enzyme S subunit|uniref:restriction endonuclease subunit S n=1 Tax=Desulfotomaculum sp. OF05-3 TaxID=2305243 RepID=UPI000E401370|nr:restriction endonuclease subunit S [Desulfotomaculum sp. OF05-3]RGE13209.1 restriction endonuclease subunit S [Desulfotomaculum sp. OF05-3]
MSYEKIEIGQLVALSQGFAINKKTNHHISDEPTNLHLLRIGDMKDGNFSIFVKNTIPEKFIAKESDIIFTRTGQVGLVFRKQYGVVHNNCFTVTTIDEDILLQEFIYYALQEKSFYEEAVSRATGAAQPDLSHGAFNSIQIYLPPIESQRKITNILNAYDILIENNKKQIKLLEEAAERLYREWFVDLHFPGYENTEIIDGVPEGWKKQKISEFGEIITGKTPSTTKKQYYGGNIPFVKIPDMHNCVYPIVTEFTLTTEGANTQKNKFIPKNGIMVSCIATVGLVNIAIETCQTNQQINSIVLNDEQDLYYTYFTMKRLKALLEGVGSNGATMTNVNKTKFGNLEVLYPGNNLRKDYFDYCKPIFEKIYALSIGVHKLSQVRDGLLPKLMSGEIEV